ncbi:MAG: xanthine dehydrogenase family protein subunit M [Gammaproteobacteria bacterium]|nr:MAG: xanthine dehydrogenase family protein subunit M [Gammaproteobacteria bacterium]
MAAYDVMPDIELFQPVTVEDASAIAARLGEKGWILAGGQDTYGWLKDRAKSPQAMVDLAAIDGINGIEDDAGGLRIGAMTTLREVSRHPLVRERFAILAEAAGKVASPQIRNQGTLGGNLAQDARCWYYRRGLACYRAGGNICYADSPEGMNREHAILGASRCVAVSPSDTGTALVALDATMVIQNGSQIRRLPASDFFVGPAVNIRHMTALREGDILTAIELPADWAGAEFYFEKVADRDVWDFALVSIAAAFKASSGTISDARLVCGAVSCVPHRLEAVERAIIGRPRSEETANDVAGLATQGTRPLNYNHFKAPLMENLVKRALRA